MIDHAARRRTPITSAGLHRIRGHGQFLEGCTKVSRRSDEGLLLTRRPCLRTPLNFHRSSGLENPRALQIVPDLRDPSVNGIEPDK